MLPEFNTTYLVWSILWVFSVFLYSTWVGYELATSRTMQRMELTLIHNAVVLVVSMFLFYYGKFHSFW